MKKRFTRPASATVAPATPTTSASTTAPAPATAPAPLPQVGPPFASTTVAPVPVEEQSPLEGVVVDEPPWQPVGTTTGAAAGPGITFGEAVRLSAPRTAGKIEGTRYLSRCPVCRAPASALEPLWAIPLSQISPVTVNGAQTTLWPILDPDPAAPVYCFDRCNTCGAIVRNPANDDKPMYRGSKGYRGQLDNQDRWAGHFAQYLAWIRKYLKPEDTALLDVCCGAGEYLLMARADAENPEVAVQLTRLVATELCEDAIIAVTDYSFGRIEAHVMDVDVPGVLGSKLGAGSFDFVVWSESFEHVADPPMVLANIFTVMKPGARIFMTAQSTEGKLPIRPGEPIYVPRAALESLLAQTGLEVLVFEESAGRWKVIARKPVPTAAAAPAPATETP